MNVLFVLSLINQTDRRRMGASCEPMEEEGQARFGIANDEFFKQKRRGRVKDVKEVQLRVSGHPAIFSYHVLSRGINTPLTVL